MGIKCKVIGKFKYENNSLYFPTGYIYVSENICLSENLIQLNLFESKFIKNTSFE